MTLVGHHAKLGHLSPAQLEALVSDFLAGTRPGQLIREYQIQASPSQLWRLLPGQLLEDEPCPACGAPMLKPLGVPHYHRHAAHVRCTSCGHANGNVCACDYCMKRLDAEVSAQVAQEERLIQDFCVSTRRPNTAPSAAREWTLRSAVLFIALVRTCELRGEGELGPVSESPIPFAPRGRAGLSFLEELLATGLVAISPHSFCNAFVIEGDQVVQWLPTEACWSVQLDGYSRTVRELEEVALHGDWPKHWFSEVAGIRRDLAIAESEEFLEYCADERRLAAPDGPKTRAMIENLLQDFSVGQTYRIIHIGCTHAADFMVRKRCSRLHASNFIIGDCQRWADRARAEHWDVGVYRRNFNCPRSQVSHVLHDVFLKLGERGFTEHLSYRFESAGPMPPMNCQPLTGSEAAPISASSASPGAGQ
jgi:hypothetical protein